MCKLEARAGDVDKTCQQNQDLRLYYSLVSRRSRVIDNFFMIELEVFIMAFRWDMLLTMSAMLTLVGLYVSCTSLQTTHVTEGENAVILFTQPLLPDKPPEVYVWSLQCADKERPFYVQYIADDSSGTFYTDMLKSPDHRDRISLSFEISEDTLFVNLSVMHVLKSDDATYLLTVAEIGSEQAFSVLSSVLCVQPVPGDGIAPTITDEILQGQRHFCALAYTAPQVQDWRYVRFSTFGQNGTIFYCFELYQSLGVLISGFLFHREDLYDEVVMVNINTSYYCCLDYEAQVRCEYYDLNSKGKITLINVTQQEPQFRITIGRPSTLHPTDTTNDGTSNTYIPPEIVEENNQNYRVALSVPLAICILVIIMLAVAIIWVVGVKPSHQYVQKRDVEQNGQVIHIETSVLPEETDKLQSVNMTN